MVPPDYFLVDEGFGDAKRFRAVFEKGAGSESGISYRRTIGYVESESGHRRHSRPRK